MSQKLLQEVAYELYKQDWIDGHTSREMRLESKQDYYNDFLTQDHIFESYEEYLEEFGFYGGMIYSSFPEFCTNEYQDEEFMHHLLGDDLYEVFEEEGAFIHNTTSFTP